MKQVVRFRSRECWWKEGDKNLQLMEKMAEGFEPTKDELITLARALDERYYSIWYKIQYENKKKNEH